MRKLTKKQIESQVDSLFKIHADRIQFNIFDLGKVLGAARQGLINGTDGVNEIKQAIEVYRVKN